MPTFRCPKCRTRLTADGSRPTVNCTQCGQLCAIPVQAAPPKPAQFQTAPPIPSGPAPSPAEPPPLSMDDVVAEEEVLDIVAPADEDAVDVVAADDDPSGSKARRSPKSRKKGKAYRKPIWMKDDDRRSGWITPESISAAIMIVLGIGFMALAFIHPSGPKILFAYGIVMHIVGIIWGLYFALNDGEGARALFWIFRWIYYIGNLERALYPLVIELVALFFFAVSCAMI